MINIKLKNGVQLITERLDEGETFWIIKNPMMLHVTKNEQSQPQIMLVPYIVETSASGEVMLNADEIQAYCSPSMELENYYIQSTSGIDLTTKLKT